MTREGPKQAGLHLRELLRRPPYARAWMQLADRRHVGTGEVNVLAVAQVLADHLRDFPRVDADRTIRARQLKDRVARALAGAVVSRETLELFVDAFRFANSDTDLLWKLWEGSDKARVLIGPAAMPPTTAAAIGLSGHRTLSLHDLHHVGAQGLPASHRTLQVIEATVDGLDRYPYRFDTSEVTIEVGLGCKGLVGPLYEVTKSVWAVDIALSGPLTHGEQTTLEYWTHFHYTSSPEPAFRRATVRRIESINIRVEFHPDRLPSGVWWSVWDGTEGEVVSGEQVQLSQEFAVQRLVGPIENTVVGFRWEW